MYINHPDSDKGNFLIAYVTFDGKFSVTATLFKKYLNPYLQFTNILFNV